MISTTRIRRGLPMLAAAMLTSPVLGAASEKADCRWQLELFDPRSDTVVGMVPLAVGEPGFRLAYTHSVFGTDVVSRYRIRGGQIVQIGEVFTDPGYGMASSTVDGEGRLTHDDGRLHLELDRPIPALTVRVQKSQNNRIEGAMSVDLGEAVGDGPIGIRPVQTCRG
ncbi:DUF1850 domain-containing protein [Roseitalea porphyridii]|nr:DUF1850 domain-containing protein [Roseitalea porphyridii]